MAAEIGKSLGTVQVMVDELILCGAVIKKDKKRGQGSKLALTELGKQYI